MSCSRKILLVIIALVVLADFLPVTRDELSWWWTQSHDHSDDYLNYLSDWPHGRHVVEARLAYDQRRWAETKRAQIRQAYAMASMPSSAKADADAAYRREQQVRRDGFFWKQATNANTVASYNHYLQQFPEGRHASEARQKMAVPGLPADETDHAAPP